MTHDDWIDITTIGSTYETHYNTRTGEERFKPIRDPGQKRESWLSQDFWEYGDKEKKNDGYMGS